MESLAQKWINQGFEQGFEQGIKLGIEKSIEKSIAAQRQTLLRVAQLRFALSAETKQAYTQQLARIRNVDHLLQLLDQLLAAQDRAVFDQAIRAYLPRTAENQ